MVDLATLFAWFVIALIFLIFIAAIVALGSLPRKIAERRNHPQTEAINVASWIGLALLGLGWPLAFVWAFLKSGSLGYEAGSVGEKPIASPSLEAELNELKRQVADLAHQLEVLKLEQKP